MVAENGFSPSERRTGRRHRRQRNAAKVADEKNPATSPHMDITNVRATQNDGHATELVDSSDSLRMESCMLKFFIFI